MPPAADAPAPKPDDAAAAAAAVVVEAAPVAEAAAIAPAAEAPAAGGDNVAAVEKPAVEGKPEAGKEPAIEAAKPADGAVKLAADEPTLLEGLDKDGKPLAEAKPGEAKPGEEKPGEKKDAKPEEKPGEVKPGEKPLEAAKPEPIVYEPFKFPDGVKLDDAKLGEAAAILGAHRVPQEAAQQLVEMHTTALQNFATHMASEQQRVFGETRKAWRTQVMADEVLGGAGHQTAMATVARMRDLFVPESRREAFNNFLRVTGAGDHPEFMRFVHAVGSKFDEATPAPQPHNPPPDAGRTKGGRRGALYDHPRSRPGGASSS